MSKSEAVKRAAQEAGVPYKDVEIDAGMKGWMNFPLRSSIMELQWSAWYNALQARYTYDDYVDRYNQTLLELPEEYRAMAGRMDTEEEFNSVRASYQRGAAMYAEQARKMMEEL